MLAFELGLLPFEELEVVSHHLSCCDTCSTVIEGLHIPVADDPVVRNIRSCLEKPLRALEPTCIEMLAALKAPSRVGMPPPRIRQIASREPIAGDHIGPYVLRGLIGRGGMGIVYRAHQTLLNRHVALKMIWDGARCGGAVVHRFLREGQAIARLSHSNVVQVYELDEWEGLPFLSMELVEGGNLRDRLVKGPLDLRVAAELTRTLALAVAYAHEAGVIHRDLNPANILMAVDDTPKIADFGLAKLLVDNDGAPGLLTEPGMIIGTPSYMAPEQADGDPARIGPAADVYALGAILYETLAGHPPFKAETRLKLLDLVVSAKPVPPSVRRRCVPFELESICLKCLEKAPERRYRTARALAEDLDRWLRGERPRGMPRGHGRHLRFAKRYYGVPLIGILTIVGWAAASLLDPDLPLRKIQSDLVSGRPVELIGQRGKPRWCRWLAGETRSRAVSNGQDGFTVHSWALALVELVPDPQSASYRVTARVNHKKSDSLGEVGLYFGHRTFPRKPENLHYFEQLGFNAVRGDAEIRAQLLEPELLRNRPLKSNQVTYRPRLYTDERAHEALDLKLPSVPGPRFTPDGEDSDTWHSLDVTITPDRIAASWDGTTFAATREVIRDAMESFMTSVKEETRASFPINCSAVFTPRGGLGLYVYRGSAAFRDITITPMITPPALSEE